MRIALLAPLLLAQLLLAQGQLAVLNGTVTDSSGAVIPRAALRLTNADTGEARGAASNEAGNYAFLLVKPGNYALSAEVEGFKQYKQTGIVLETGMQARLDIRMEVGVVTQSTSVEAAMPQLQSDTSAVSTVVDHVTITNMPLIDRRAAQLARLSGFMVQIGTGQDFAMAGGRGGNAQWFVDGGVVQNLSLGHPGPQFDPPVESLQEFNVAVSNYAAELGRTGGGVVQMTTRSGTNQLHGSAYEYLRNDAFDARSFFSAVKPKLRYSLFGASAGGPIRKDKTHFFFNYEGLRDRRETTRIVNIPAPAETRGDFSGSSIVIRDPSAAGRPPFPGNVIPAARMDPVGAKLAALYPAPNVPGRPSANSNYRMNQPIHTYNDNYVLRIDQTFSDNDRAYGRFLVKPAGVDNLPIFPQAGVDQFNNYTRNSYQSLSASWFHGFTPVLINEFRGSFVWRGYKAYTGQPEQSLLDQLGLKGTAKEFFPRVNLTGLAGLGGAGAHLRLQEPVHDLHLLEHVSYIRGKHRFKAGFEWRYARNDDLARTSAGGVFAFNDTATGNALASLLLGWVQQGSRVEALPLRTRSDTIGSFVQDDWKVSPNLTINLGLRWDLDQPRWEKIDNRQNSFDRNAINPASGTPGVVTFSGRNGLGKYAHNRDWNNFGPRFGFALRLGSKWVARGGAAVIYAGQYDQPVLNVAMLGFSIEGLFVSPDSGLTRAFLLRDGLPPVNTPGEAGLTPAFGAVPVGGSTSTSVTFFEPGNRRNGYMETFNLNLQRQFTANLALEIGYLGTLGHKLTSSASRTINQVAPDRVGAGNAQVKRPFPQFSDVLVLAPAIGNSNYHALNVKLDKRYSRGLHFQANYTWSRFIDDIESRIELGGSAGSGYQDYYNRRGDRGLSGNHISHRLIWSSVYELPVKPAGAFWKAVGAGWSSGVIAEFRTGSPLGVLEQVNRTNAFSDSQRPDVVGSPDLPGGRSRADQIERWFNTSAFAQPAQYKFGNAGRTVGYGPGAIIVDISILKEFVVHERHRVQFRTEMLNSINNPNFGLPGLQRGSPTFGRISSLIDGNQARIIQFGLHYKF